MSKANTRRSQRTFTLTNSVFWAGKAGASCALALLMVKLLEIPDMVTASFVAVLCCSPAALMGLQISLEQFAGSAIGGALGTVGVILSLPQVVGVPVAVCLAMLATQLMGLYRATLVAAFTALFVQIVSFGEPMETFGYRMAAVCVAAMSAFVVNVVVSSFFYRSLFNKRIGKLGARILELSINSPSEGVAPMHSLFASISQLLGELGEAKRELEWRGNKESAEQLAEMQAKVIWMRAYVHLVVDLEFVLDIESEPAREFLSWLVRREGQAPALPQSADCTRDRILEHLQTHTDLLAHDRDRGESENV